jgi:hypothetical protein
MDEEVDDKGVVHLEKKTVLQYLSNLLGVLLLELLGCAKLLERRCKAAITDEEQKLHAEFR